MKYLCSNCKSTHSLWKKTWIDKRKRIGFGKILATVFFLASEAKQMNISQRIKVSQTTLSGLINDLKDVFATYEKFYAVKVKK